MDGQQFGNIPASRFGNAANEAMYPQHDIKAQIEGLSQKIEKVIEINIMLQQKITKLGEAITELAGELHSRKEEISLPEPMEGVPSPHGIPPAPVFEFEESEERAAEKPHAAGDVVKQMQLLTDQNMALIDEIRSVKEKIGKESGKEKIARALHRAGAL
ncbi:MAG: hypothetical protein PHC66_03670 [Candidatus Nanoarchaeia archaeon]|nr:hypothetical protein [Candidatus Nanoarchaeia archaeon]MDD5238954.1 hypothetical protein [Candidatus Nanoarchaeia archaeon]